MHYFALVQIPTGTTYEQAHAIVEELLAPHQERFVENGKTDKYGEADGELLGFWDWWVIGGRWTGVLDGYDPSADPVNQEQCVLCRGSGLRDDEVGRQHRATHPDYTCNGCQGSGVSVKFRLAPHEGDLRSKADVIRAEAQSPYTLVTPERVTHKKDWTGSTFVDTNADFMAHWASIPDDAALVVVDYHC